jgi:AAA ATPase domain
MPAQRPSASTPGEALGAPPDPGAVSTLDELVNRLRLLKVWAGDPSYGTITSRVNEAWTAAGRPAGSLVGKTTVVDCFRAGRRRVNADLVVAVVQALHPDVGYVSQWRQALHVVRGQTRAAAQVRVQGELPPDLATFTGRTHELSQLRSCWRQLAAGTGQEPVCLITGMPGVGKTQLAVHAAHLLIRDGLAAGASLNRVLFANLRGFDPAHPPADPAAVLEGFLRLLGVPGHRVPPALNDRVAAYQSRLAETRTLVVLDNAADADQVVPLLPGTPDSAGCLVLVTSRRALPALHPGLNLSLDVFDPDEARGYVTRAAAGVHVGDDPQAANRIARRCGYLPLALGLVAAHIAGTPGWTLTDHADWLDERHTGAYRPTGNNSCDWPRCTPGRTSTRTPPPPWPEPTCPAPKRTWISFAATTCCRSTPPAGTPSTIWSAPTRLPGPATAIPHPRAGPP